VEPAPELVAILDRVFESWSRHDADAVLDAISRHAGSLVIGFDEREWWEGYDTIAAIMRVQILESDWVESEHKPFDRVVAWKEGTVGWVSAQGQTHLDTKQYTHRFTFVLHQEGAYWRIVTWNASLAVSNEDALGRTMTTSLDDLLIDVHDELPPATATASDGSVTIVFTDVEGSTELMESLGEECWLELLAWHDAAVRQQTAVFGGTVVKGQGDGFMLAFPAVGPAAACAVAIQRALSGGWAGLTVPVRIGIHNGNATAEGGDFFGRTVVVAARIASAAAGQEILVSQTVQEALGGAFTLGEVKSLSLKGLAGQHTALALAWR